MNSEILEQQRRDQSVQEILHKLNQLNCKIQQNSNNCIDLIKDYATIYVQNHNLSDDFFSVMCQHNMIAKLFSGMSKSLHILEIFNLILANTSNQSELVYIFSHPLFHQYLLNNFNPSKETSQSIQYYIQLIKTVVMKLQLQSNSSLLKLFCNNKYPQFPLLLNCLVLAIKKNVKQDLVRVTALHCILQLIQLIIKKQLGYGYLSEIHIFIFFYEVIKQVIQEELIDEENMLKYIIDLIKALKYNEQSIMIFFSLFTNLLLFQNISNPAPALHILSKLSIYFSQSEQLTQFVPKYLGPIYQIIAKYMYNRYLSNTEVAIVLTLKQIAIQQQNQYNLIKLVKDRFLKKQIADYVFAVDDKIKVSFEKSIKQKVNKYNQENPNFIALKQNYLKNKKQGSGSWLYSAFMKKFSTDFSNIQYLKKLTILAGVKFDMTQPINIALCTNEISAIYFYQFYQVKTKQRYLFGQKSEDTLKTQINYNEFRGEFLMNSQFLKTVNKILQIVQKQLRKIEQNLKQNQYRKILNFLSQKYDSKIQHLGEVYFILHMRKYFQCSLFQYFYEEKQIKQKKQIKLLFIILNKLSLDLDSNCKNKIYQKFIMLKQELKAYIKQNGFKCFLKYIQMRQQSQMTTKYSQIKVSQIKFSNTLTQSKKKDKRKSIFKDKIKQKQQKSKFISQNNDKDFDLITFKLLQFELIRTILFEKEDQKKQNIFQQIQFQNNLGGIAYRKYVQKYHSYLLRISSQQPSTQLYIKNIKYHNNQDCRFVVSSDPNQISIICSVKLYNKTIIQGSLNNFDLKLDENQNQVNLGIQYTNASFKNKQQAKDFILQMTKIKFQFEELLSGSVQQYLNVGNQLHQVQTLII